MTPTLITGFGLTSPMFLPEPLAQLEHETASHAPAPAAATDMGYAVVGIGSSRQAQGPVLRRYRDGRVSIDAGGSVLTGHPVGGTAPRGWWARMGIRVI